VIKSGYYETLTGPTGSPVDLALFKSHARIDFDAEDAILQTYLDTALLKVEEFSNQSMRPAQVRGNYAALDAKQFNDYPFVDLQRAPIRSVDAVRLWDGSQFEVLTENVSYRIEQKAGYWRVVFDEFSNLGFFSLSDDQQYPVQVDFSIGPADAANADSRLKLAVLHWAAWLYDNGGECGGEEMPSTVRKLIGSKRILRVFG